MTFRRLEDTTHGKLTHKNTIMPRLGYCSKLLDQALANLLEEYTFLRKANDVLRRKSSHYESSELLQIDLEKTLHYAIESLIKIQKRLHSLSGISSIPVVLPPTIPALRAISSQLHDLFPKPSQDIGELSSILGGIIIDSATITEARFDFRQTNSESNTMLDEAKLMADSKINKLYPNVDSPRVKPT